MLDILERQVVEVSMEFMVMKVIYLNHNCFTIFIINLFIFKVLVVPMELMDVAEPMDNKEFQDHLVFLVLVECLAILDLKV